MIWRFILEVLLFTFLIIKIMIDCDILVSDDDDSCLEITDEEINPKRKKTINKTVSNTMEIIELDNVEERLKLISKYASELLNNNTDYNSIFRENRLLAEFVETCLNLENSEGMFKVINNRLLSIFKEMDEGYKQSEEFERVLNKALIRLAADPDHKFSHISNLCDTMSFHKAKKRVKLITLAKNLKEKGSLKRTLNSFSSSSKRKKLSTIVIESDDDEVPYISSEEDPEPDDEVIMDELVPENDEEKENEENSILDITEIESSQENKLLEPQVEVYDQNHSNVLLEPNSWKTSIDSESSIDSQIRLLEKRIDYYKKKVKILDESEVINDTVESPYIQCEKLKEKIVLLHKELCQLMGKQPNKTKRVQLKVSEGHPTGPVKRLEELLHKNAGKDGSLGFPDFTDVVMCVLEANREDSLGWNKTQVMAQANSLFTQCGRALQKRRQKREYKDLLAMAHNEEPHDPADDDPILLAKLEENRKIAVKKETAILEKYTALQNFPQKLKTSSNPNPGDCHKQSRMNQEDEEDNSVKTIEGPMNDDQQNFPQKPKTGSNPNAGDCQEQSRTNQKEEESNSVQTSKDQTNDVKNCNSGNITKMVNGDITKVVNSVANLNSMLEKTLWPNQEKNISFDSAKSLVCSDVNVSEVEVIKIKKEPVDIIKLLEELGDNFTTSVIDIEDPFFVTVISDSSDDES